ncbi:MAG: helix-turn-helix transcriptional regulator [Clostridia bacterium]|nr:helix-turn-helix transcriptional regulator [Clostridia bacterium]
MPEMYDRIEKLCKEKGINITLMCKECKIPRASLSDYKKGRKKSLSAETLAKIAGYFAVSVDYLYGGSNSASVERELKVALFGGDGEVTDEMWEEVKRYARYIKEKK